MKVLACTMLKQKLDEFATPNAVLWEFKKVREKQNIQLWILKFILVAF